MASQPNNCSQDVRNNNPIDWDDILSPSNGFRHEYENLLFSAGDGLLLTPDFQTENPFVPPTLGSYIGSIQEPPVSFEAADDANIYTNSDTEDNENAMDNNSHQHLDTQAEAMIAEIENDLRNAANEISDRMDIETVMTAIGRHPNPIMRIHTQPIARHRFRYRTDGIRYLERSRKDPLAINLPILNGCLIRPHQKFWIQLTIVTTRQNPRRKVFVHQHELMYNEANAHQNGLQSVRLPVDDEEIRLRRKTIRYLSIIKTRLNDYQFDLVPFDPLLVDDHVEYYTIPNEDQMSKIQKAKQFDRSYHTNEYQIVCQLMIQQKDQWYMTDISCETQVVTDN